MSLGAATSAGASIGPTDEVDAIARAVSITLDENLKRQAELENSLDVVRVRIRRLRGAAEGLSLASEVAPVQGRY